MVIPICIPKILVHELIFKQLNLIRGIYEYHPTRRFKLHLWETF